MVQAIVEQGDAFSELDSHVANAALLNTF